MKGKSQSVVSNFLWPHGQYNPWNSLGQNTRVGSLSLLQGIFPIQEWNRGLLHCRQILYQLSCEGSPYMQSTSFKMLGWMKLKLESRLQVEISITSDMHVTPPLWQKAIRRTKESLDDSERGEWKMWLKTKVMASSPITSWQIDGETMETMTDYFLGLQNHRR